MKMLQFKFAHKVLLCLRKLRKKVEYWHELNVKST